MDRNLMQLVEAGTSLSVLAAMFAPTFGRVMTTRSRQKSSMVASVLTLISG